MRPKRKTYGLRIREESKMISGRINLILKYMSSILSRI